MGIDSDGSPSWRHRLGSLWREVDRWRWWILLGLFVVTLALGVWGFAAYYDGSSAQRSASQWDQLYLLAHLFTINLGVLASDAPWQIHLARFLGIVFALALGLAALVTVFQDQVDRLRLLIRPPQVVILGLGSYGSIAAQSFATGGNRVAAVENAGGLDVETCRDAGVIVLHGDATDAGLLETLRLYRAETIVVTCGSETANATVTMRIGEQLRSERADRWWRGRTRDPVRCLVHIEDSLLCAVLRRSGAVRDAELAGPLHLTFFNPSSLAAPALLDQHPIGTDGTRPHLLIVGLGEMGRQLLIHAARVWRFSGAQSRTGQPLFVTVVDRQAAGRCEQLDVHDPELSAHADIHAHDVDVTSAPFVKLSFLDEEPTGPEVTHVVVCLDDDVRAAAAALTLRDGLRKRRIEAPVVVRMFLQSGLASVLRVGGSSTTDGIRPLALVDWTCQAEILLDLRNELIARAFHQIYLDQQRKVGGTAAASASARPWDELDAVYRASNRDLARHAIEKLAAVGCVLRPIDGWDGGVTVFSDDEVELLARMEHDRWLAFMAANGWRYGPVRNAQRNPAMVDYEELPGDLKATNRAFVEELPQVLVRAGFFTERIRTTPGPLIDPAEPRTEALARSIHERYVTARLSEGAKVGSAPSLRDWDDLPETLKSSNREQAADIDVKLQVVNCRAVPAGEEGDVSPLDEFHPEELEQLAIHEHARWVRERVAAGWVQGEVKDVRARTSPYLVSWEELSEEIRELDRQAVRAIPGLLKSVGESVLRMPQERAKDSS